MAVCSACKPSKRGCVPSAHGLQRVAESHDSSSSATQSTHSRFTSRPCELHRCIISIPSARTRWVGLFHQFYRQQQSYNTQHIRAPGVFFLVSPDFVLFIKDYERAKAVTPSHGVHGTTRDQSNILEEEQLSTICRIYSNLNSGSG